MDTDLFLNGKTYCIYPSSLHGLGLFSMDGINVSYGTEIELMEYVGPCYKYNDWLLLVRYMRSMQTYKVATNYCQLLENSLNKGATVYIDGSPKDSGNIPGFINSTRLGSTHKLPNFLFEGRERNRVFVCATKSIAAGEELLIDYGLNRTDAGVSIMGVSFLYNI